MDGEKILFTREGYEKLKAELDNLVSKKRLEIAEDLRRARAMGDLRENAEYESAKHAQALNEKRIAEIGNRLLKAQIIDKDAVPKDEVFFGSRVTIKDQKNGQTIQYQIVSAEEADFQERKISAASPVGKALLRRKAGDLVTIKVPAGELSYKILKIER